MAILTQRKVSGGSIPALVRHVDEISDASSETSPRLFTLPRSLPQPCQSTRARGSFTYRAINGDAVDFDYRGIDDALVDSVMVADLRWTGRLLSRLSERQWLDAFRAGGYTADQSARYVRKIREKITQAVGA